jgi:hypothetical protein
MNRPPLAIATVAQAAAKIATDLLPAARLLADRLAANGHGVWPHRSMVMVFVAFGGIKTGRAHARWRPVSRW